jgi:hypothetical protein
LQGGSSRWVAGSGRAAANPEDGIGVEVAVVQHHVPLQELQLWLLQDAGDGVAVLCERGGEAS